MLRQQISYSSTWYGRYHKLHYDSIRFASDSRLIPPDHTETHPCAQLIKDVIVPLILLLMHKATLFQEKRKRPSPVESPARPILQLDVFS